MSWHEGLLALLFLMLPAPASIKIHLGYKIIMTPTGISESLCLNLPSSQDYRLCHQVQLHRAFVWRPLPLLSSCQPSTEQQGDWEFVTSFQDLILIGREGIVGGCWVGVCPGQVERRNIFLTTQPTCYCLVRSLGLIIFWRQRCSGTARLSSLGQETGQSEAVKQP